MLSILFWNLKGNDAKTWARRAPALRTHLAHLVTFLGIDVLVLAESNFAPAELVDVLNGGQPGAFCYPESNSRRIQLFTRLPASAVIDQFNDSSDGRLTIRRLTTPSNNVILLAALHFQSRITWSDTAQALQAATGLREDIAKTEDAVGHQRTVLIGDLNMNPFHPGLIGAQTLNAVMTRELARRKKRKVAGRTYHFFYNPMWSCFGDRTVGPPGTWFDSSSSPDSYFWNMFDQVLLRPALMDQLSEMRILDRDGEESLLTKQGRPQKSEVSDHLPLLVRLEL